MEFQTKRRFNIIKDLIGNSDGKVILDIGAGKDPISEGLKAKRIIRFDGVKEYNPDICGDINKGIPLKDSTVDIIIAGEIIEHIYNSYKFLSECSRVLKFGGVLILSTPNLCSLKNRIKVLFGNLPEYCARPSGTEGFHRHIVDFNFSALDWLMKKHSLKIIKSRTNGIIFHSRLMFPVSLTSIVFGEILILKAQKVIIKEVFLNEGF